MACAGSGAHSACPPAQRGPGRRVRRAEAAAAGPDPADAVVFRPGLPQPVPRHHAVIGSSAILCDRSGARGRRQLARHRQSYRDAGRRRLRACQPRRAHAHRRRPVRSQQQPAPGAVLPARADRPDATHRAPRSAHRAADTGPAPRRLFQPCLPRPLSRLSAGRGRRLAHRRRPRLSEDAGRTAAHRPHRALRRRPPSRSPRARQRALRRPVRPRAGVPQGARSGAQRTRLGRGAEPRSRRLPAGDLPQPATAKTCLSPTRRVGGSATPPTASTSSPTSTAW